MDLVKGLRKENQGLKSENKGLKSQMKAHETKIQSLQYENHLQKTEIKEFKQAIQKKVSNDKLNSPYKKSQTLEIEEEV